jgi:ABC-type molybdate transport system ATPase subunit
VLGDDLLGGGRRVRMVLAADDVSRAGNRVTSQAPAALRVTVVELQNRTTSFNLSLTSDEKDIRGVIASTHRSTKARRRWLPSREE